MEFLKYKRKILWDSGHMQNNIQKYLYLIREKLWVARLTALLGWFKKEIRNKKMVKDPVSKFLLIKI